MDSKTKKIVAVVVVVCLLVVGVAAFVLSNNSSNNNDSKPVKESSWSSIKNFSNYNYLAVGTEKTTQSKINSPYANSLVANESNGEEMQKMKLYGLDVNNNYVMVEFEDTEGKTQEQKANLIHYDNYSRASIAVFSTTTDKYQDAGWNKNVEMRSYRVDNAANDSLRIIYTIAGSNDPIVQDVNGLRYLIDNKTGNIYSMQSIVDKVKATMLYLYTPSLDTDTIYVIGWFDNNDQRMYSITFKDKNLELQEVMNADQFNNFTYDLYYSNDYFDMKVKLDKFGNMYSGYSNAVLEKDLKSSSIVRLANGTFTKLSAMDENFDSSLTYKYALGVNGYIYLWASNAEGVVQYSAYVGSDGKFHKTDEVLGDVSGNGICSNGDKYYMSICTMGSHDYDVILKEVTLDKNQDWKYTVTQKTLFLGEQQDKAEKMAARFVGLGSDIYTFYESTLYHYDVETGGDVGTIPNSNKINDLFFDEKSKVVKIVVVDSSSIQNVNGYIDPIDQTIVLEEFVIETGNKEIYIVDPVNKS